jgi:hypothetical protein
MKGGIAIASLRQLTKMSEDTIKAVMTEYRLINADVTLRTDISLDQLIDALEGNRVYIPGIIIVNKILLFPLIIIQ